MDAKGIERLGRDLAKANASSEPPATLHKLLDELRNGVTATEEILRSTKIGISVNKVRQHSDASVAQKAADLVNKWKKEIKAKQEKEKAAGARSSPAVAASNGHAGAGVVKEEKVKDKTFKSSVPLEQRNAKTDGADTAKTGNNTRDACLRLMYDGLAYMSEEPPSAIIPVATSIEQAAFTMHKSDTSAEYKSKLRSLFQNLKNKTNQGLRSRVLSGEISPDRFVSMSLEELKSDQQREEEKQMEKENMDKAMVAQEEQPISEMFACNKCGNKKVAYTQAQTRSADEPMTTFCRCTVCNNRWKFS